MTKKQSRFLREILDAPDGCDVPWKEAERILTALGARVREGSSSRIRVELNGVKGVFQRPAMDKTSRGAILCLSRFLREARFDLNEI